MQPDSGFAHGKKIDPGGEAHLEPLAVDARAAARMCGVSRTHWYAMKASGRLPLPIRLGRRTVWRVDDLKRWVAEGCPPLHRWQQMNAKK